MGSILEGLKNEVEGKAAQGWSVRVFVDAARLLMTLVQRPAMGESKLKYVRGS